MKSKYLKRLTATIICLSMVLGIMLPATAAWDGYKAPDGGNIVKLVNFNSVGEILLAGALPSDNAIGGDRYSLLWQNTNTKTSLSFYSMPSDWSQYSEIRFSVYSPKPSKGTFIFKVHTEVPFEQTQTHSYFQTGNISTNHVGWKEYTFKKSDFSENLASGWDKVIRVEFNPITKEENANYCISSIYGVTTEEEPVLKLDATQEGRTSVFEALGDNTAIMNFSNNVIKNGEILPVNVPDRITTDHSGTIAKFGLFSNVLGATVNDENGKVSITLDGQTADVTDKVITYDDGKYLKVNPTLEALGKTVKTYDMVTIIGDEERTNKIFDDELLLDDLKYMLNVSVLTPKDITKADWELVKKQWREYIVGPADGVITPSEQEKIALLDADYLTISGSINKDPKIFSIFGKTKIADGNNVYQAAVQLKKMAVAYATEGSKYYKDPDARRSILECLEWMYENVYGLQDLSDDGFKKRISTDNWYFHIGTPMELAEVILLLGDDISMEFTKKVLYVFEQSKSSGFCGVEGRVYVGSLSAVLNEDYEELLKLNSDYLVYLGPKPYTIDRVLREGANEGSKEDGQYIYHKFYAYTSAYGCAILLDRMVPVQSALMGTNFEFPNPYKYNTVKWLRESFEPIIYNGAITSAQSGRFRGSDQFSEPTYTRYVISAALDLIGCFGKDDDEWLKRLVKRNVVEGNVADIRKLITGPQLEKLNEILSDETIEVEPYYNSKVYYSGDMLAHQKGDFGFAVAMSSSRIGAWEAIVAQNLTGWYQGDGMLYTYLKNDVAHYDREYWKYVNPYHLSGTTVDTQPRVAASLLDYGETRTSQHFVGGVQFDNDYSIAAMQLESHHFDNPNAVIRTTHEGGDFPHRECTLMGKKAWFLFDDEAVALGTDIDADDGFEVQTIVENRKLNKFEEIVKDESVEPAEIIEYKIVDVKESAHAAENVAEKSLDGNLNTFWSISGEGDLTYELEKAVPVGYVGIAQYNSRGNRAIFDLEASVDGKTWTKVIKDGRSSGKSNDFEGFDMKGTVAKYIRYKGYARENYEWNLIAEVRIFAPMSDGSSPISSIVQNVTENPEDTKIMGIEKITVDGTLLEKASSYRKEFTNPKWLHIENVGGYFFPQGGNLVMDKLTNTHNFLEVWFTHGVSPKDATYAYVVLPTKSPEEVDAYTKSPDIEILSNTEKLQVVREKTLGLSGLVFWEAGKWDNITTSVPLMMMVKEKDAQGHFRLAITDPTKLLKEGKVTLKGNYELVDGDKRHTVTSNGTETVITINFDGAEGRTLPITLLAK